MWLDRSGCHGRRGTPVASILMSEVPLQPRFLWSRYPCSLNVRREKRGSRAASHAEAAPEEQLAPAHLHNSQFQNNHFTEMCSVFEAGSYLMLADFVYHSTLGLRVLKEAHLHMPAPTGFDIGCQIQPLLQPKWFERHCTWQTSHRA